jgi:hypothetical protein
MNGTMRGHTLRSLPGLWKNSTSENEYHCLLRSGDSRDHTNTHDPGNRLVHVSPGADGPKEKRRRCTGGWTLRCQHRPEPSNEGDPRIVLHSSERVVDRR